MTQKMFRRWQQELTKAIREMDVCKFRRFYRKWQLLGIYDKPLPENNMVIEISLRKMAVNKKGIPEEERETARAWLKAHGCSEDW